MVRIPIVIAFDDNFVMQAGVFLTSLMENVSEQTFYEVNVLHICLSEQAKERIKALEKFYNDKLKINFHCTKEFVQSGYEVREITSTTYCRLAIPFILKQYSRVLYLDVDMIVCDDLTSLYNINLKGKAIGGVRTDLRSIQKHLHHFSYINAGVLVWDLNNTDMKKASFAIGLITQQKFKFQDQDIINKVFRKNIYSLIDIRYNYMVAARKWERCQKLFYPFSTSKLSKKPIIVHFTGNKPWSNKVLGYELWWEYYSRSIFYNKNFEDNFYRTNR